MGRLRLNDLNTARAAFVMEQSLGHVTHAKNLREVLGSRADLAATWLPIPFEATGLARVLPLVRSNWSVRAGWRTRRALARALTRERHDALVFHTQVTALFSVGLMRRIPSVVSLDATPVNYDSVGAAYGHRPANSTIVDRQKYRMNQAVFHAATHLITWSEWARRSLVDDYGVSSDRIRVLAPGASARFFTIGEQRMARCNVWTDNRDDRVKLLFVGGDFARKGGPLLLDLMQGPLGERCELHLVTPQALPARSNVHVYNGIGPNSPQLTQLFADADLFVLPSNAECLAVVLMEATAAGLPVVTTPVGAMAEGVRHGQSGFLVAPGDGNALNDAVSSLVSDADLRRRMGAVGHALARQRFDSQSNNAALLDMVVELARKKQYAKRAA
jgi:glycosyltransferase involved in cell wall biosynthesis